MAPDHIETPLAAARAPREYVLVTGFRWDRVRLRRESGAWMRAADYANWKPFDTALHEASVAVVSVVLVASRDDNRFQCPGAHRRRYRPGVVDALPCRIAPAD